MLSMLLMLLLKAMNQFTSIQILNVSEHRPHIGFLAVLEFAWSLEVPRMDLKLLSFLLIIERQKKITVLCDGKRITQITQ